MQKGDIIAKKRNVGYTDNHNHHINEYGGEYARKTDDQKARDD